MRKINIYELNGSFEIYDGAGHLIKGGFASHDEATSWAMKRNYVIQDIFLAIWEINPIFASQN